MSLFTAILFFSYLISCRDMLALSENRKLALDPNSEILAPMNSFRALYCLPPLVWDNELATVADNYAQQCIYAHTTYDARTNAYAAARAAAGKPALQSPQDSVGENLAAAEGEQVDTTGWTGEKSSWTCGTDGYYTGCKAGAVCGHYTQIVWNTTSGVGCARYQCGGNTSPFNDGKSWNYLVCNFNPAGNYENVSPFPASQCSGCGGGNPQPPPPTKAQPTKKPPPTKKPTSPPPTKKPTSPPTHAPTKKPPPTRAPTNVCLATGDCTDDSQCCSGNCYLGRVCQKAGSYTQYNRRCTAKDATLGRCASNADCCSNQCANTKCK